MNAQSVDLLFKFDNRHKKHESCQGNECKGYGQVFATLSIGLLSHAWSFTYSRDGLYQRSLV